MEFPLGFKQMNKVKYVNIFESTLDGPVCYTLTVETFPFTIH